jgi:hypothetical protein
VIEKNWLARLFFKSSGSPTNGRGGFPDCSAVKIPTTASSYFAQDIQLEIAFINHKLGEMRAQAYKHSEKFKRQWRE